MNSLTENNEFYLSLLDETEKAYDKRRDSSPRLSYSIAATPIREKKGLILGINWGGSRNKFENQKSMPVESDLTSEKIRVDYKFLQRSKAFLKEKMELDFDSVDFNYSNLCFFRSQKEKDLITEDYKLCFPIFEKYVRYIKPPWILSMGLNNVVRLKQLNVTEMNDLQPLPDKAGKYKGYNCTLFGFPFYCVPHPNARLTTESRKAIWDGVDLNIK